MSRPVHRRLASNSGYAERAGNLRRCPSLAGQSVTWVLAPWVDVHPADNVDVGPLPFANWSRSDRDPVAAATVGAVVGQVAARAGCPLARVATRSIRSSRPSAGTVAKNPATLSRPTIRTGSGGIVRITSSHSNAAKAAMSQSRLAPACWPVETGQQTVDPPGFHRCRRGAQAGSLLLGDCLGEALQQEGPAATALDRAVDRLATD